MPEKISILKESGETLSSNIVSVFMIPDTEKRYIITTENAVDPHGLTVLHVSEIADGSLQKVATDDEWSTIKTIMRAIISGNVGSYKYIPAIESINASGTYSRDISVSASAAKQMVDNYNSSEKSGATLDSTPAEAPLDQNDAVGNQVNPNSIFPNNDNNIANEDEVVPGIAELNSPVMPASPSEQSLEPVQLIQPVNAVQPPAPEMGVVENDSMVVSNNPVTRTVVVPSVGQVNQMADAMAPQPVEIQPVTPIGIPPVDNTVQVVSPVGLGQPLPETEDPIAVNQPLVEAQPTVIDPMSTIANPVQVEQPIAQNIQNTGVMPVVDPNAQIGLQNTGVVPVVNPSIQPVAGIPNPSPQPIMPDGMGIQVANPSTIVPNAQIAEEASPTPSVVINQSATPSFAPNASLDEVVMGAQEMFMEGVKNLVQTIQEKVYRDLYNKEAELKNREAIIEQKEQLINGQMLAMMSNFTNNFNALQNQGVPSMPQQPIAPMPQQPMPPQGQMMQPNQMVMPPIIQPTVVQASNDANQT